MRVHSSGRATGCDRRAIYSAVPNTDGIQTLPHEFRSSTRQSPSITLCARLTRVSPLLHSRFGNKFEKEEVVGRRVEVSSFQAFFRFERNIFCFLRICSL